MPPPLKGAFLCAGRGGDGIGSAKARGGRAPGPPAGGGSAPRPLRSCGAEVESGRGVGLSRGCEGCKGCFSKGCEWLGLGNRLRRFPKGFWGMVGYGREIGWGTCKVAGNRSVRGGRRRLAAGGASGPPASQTKARAGRPFGPPCPCFVRASRARRPPAWPQRPPYSPGRSRPATGRSRPAGGGTNPVEVRRSLRSQHNHRDQPKEQDQQPHNHAQHDPDRLVAGGGRRLGQRLPVLG